MICGGWKFFQRGMRCSFLVGVYTSEEKLYTVLPIDDYNLGGGFKYFVYFHPDPWGNNPI